MRVPMFVRVFMGMFMLRIMRVRVFVNMLVRVAVPGRMIVFVSMVVVMVISMSMRMRVRCLDVGRAGVNAEMDSANAPTLAPLEMHVEIAQRELR